jgi:4-amino-4-deoxy-L-arabinose transferase-like glycosyltransferase
MRLKQTLLLVAILLAALVFWTHDLDRPFTGHFDLIDTTWTIYADNLIRYGVFGARFGDVENIAPAAPADLRFGNYHPPLLTFALVPLRWLLGPSELATRIVPVFFTLLAMAAVYRLARRTFPGSEVLAVFFAAFAPVVMYYSTITTQELLNLVWIGLTLYVYSHWLDAPDPRWRRGLIVLAVLGGWTDWVYYLLIIYLLLHAIWAVGLRRARTLWPLVLALGFTGITYLAVNLWQRPDFIAAFTQHMLGRLTDATPDNPYLGTGYPGFGPYLVLMVVRIGQVFTPFMILLAGTGAWQVWRHRCEDSRRFQPGWRRPGVLLLPVATTLTFMLVLQREAHYLHDFLVYHLILCLALCAAFGFRHVLYRFGPPTLAGRAVLGIFLVLFLIAAVGYWGVYRAFDVRPERADWGLAIRPYARPGDLLAGNLEQSQEHLRVGFGQTLGYYAGTDARWDVSLEEVISGAVSPDFYVYCPPTLVTPDASGDLPDGLVESAVDLFERDGCWFVDLKA